MITAIKISGIVLLMNIGHVLNIVAIEIASMASGMPVHSISPHDNSFSPTAKYLDAIGDKLLIAGPILFCAIPFMLLSVFLFNRYIKPIPKPNLVNWTSGWLIGSLLFALAFYLPHYQWLFD